MTAESEPSRSGGGVCATRGWPWSQLARGHESLEVEQQRAGANNGGRAGRRRGLLQQRRCLPGPKSRAVSPASVAGGRRMMHPRLSAPTYRQAHPSIPDATTFTNLELASVSGKGQRHTCGGVQPRTIWLASRAKPTPLCPHLAGLTLDHHDTMPHLPRVPAFPIAGERSLLTAAGAALKIPAKEKDSPLIGHFAPEIIATDHLGRTVSLHATIALGRPIVLYFFPLAGSPHCTKESCSFRDAVGASPIFNDLNAVVIGISQDPPARSRRFVDEHHLGFRILHDSQRHIMDAWGVGRGLLGLIDGRCTFVIDHQGVVRAMLDGVWDYQGHRNFAEKWLCRIEHELSGRERFYIAHDDEGVACEERTSRWSMAIPYLDGELQLHRDMERHRRRKAHSSRSSRQPRVCRTNSRWVGRGRDAISRRGYGPTRATMSLSMSRL